VTYRVTVPAGASGTLVLSHDYEDVRVDDQDIGSGGKEATRTILAAGPHVATFRLRRSQGGEKR
jgi:hypothetical protein